MARIANDLNEFLRSFHLSNVSSFDKVTEPHKSLLTGFIEKLREIDEDLVESVYLVGSLGRGEYEQGYSDVNLYVIFRGDLSKINVELIASLIPYHGELNLKVFKKIDFLSEENKKYRLIVKADGVLLFGSDLLEGEEFPDVGLFTALILNNDILDEFKEARRWIEENPNASPAEISKTSKGLAKRIIDFIYGVVMANKPQYTSSRTERIEAINEMFPGQRERDTLKVLVEVSRHGVGEFQSFKTLIEEFRPRIEKNLKQMKDEKRRIDV